MLIISVTMRHKVNIGTGIETQGIRSQKNETNKKEIVVTSYKKRFVMNKQKQISKQR